MARQDPAHEPALVVVGATTHNLKHVSCRIPHGRVTVVTGPSGAGKSSLAFDTVYAEAQRRYVESMSTYARQFLEQMERPPVEAVYGVLPAVALEAKNSVKNARSTVGTLTEVHDVLRLLFTHLGDVACPNGHGEVRRSTSSEAAAALAGGEAGERFLVVAELDRPAKQADVKLRELVRQGYFRRLEGRRLEGRRLEGGDVVEMKPSERWPTRLDPLPLVVGRFKAGKDSPRLAAAIEEAYKLAAGRVVAVGRTATGEAVRRHYGRELTCPVCGARQRPPSPALFSFNSPLGACSTCQGFGRVIGIDRRRVVPDPSKSLAERPIAPWNTPSYEELYDGLLAAARRRGVPLDVPWEDLPEADREWVWSGDSGGRIFGAKLAGKLTNKFTSLDRWFQWLERRNYKMHVRVLLSRYRAYDECPHCRGARLSPESLAVTLLGETLPEISRRSIEAARAWLATARWTPRQRARAGHLLEELRERLDTLDRVGLGYLTLDRQARTLSGGESQRIQLAASLGSGLTSTLYVLDEPTIGLHPQDSERLLDLLHDLAGRGNTVLVVEHDRTIIAGADHIIDMGPMAGEHGGEVVAEGSLGTILQSDRSLTASYLRERPATPARDHLARFRREHGRDSLADEIAKRPRVEIRGARAHNLRGFDVTLPLEALVAVTGVSGSGKSTLVENVLYGTYQRARGVVDVEPGECDVLLGLDELEDVTLVDQRPLGRSTRSNPVTYIKAYDDIRKLYAGTAVARRRGIAAGHFSFNLDRGRCPECQGTGTLEVDMQFMAPVSVVCDTCQGHRFRPEVLAVTYAGRTIHETLELTVDAALEVFRDKKRLVRRLQALVDVGLGYLRLGQATSTLSGGEAQRLKLASFLERPAKEKPRLFLFDEPTTGLHLADIDLLYRTLRRLVQRGDGVIVVEHSLDLVARADWIVDLGPGGGTHGGELLYTGPLEGFLDDAEGPTADALRRHMRWKRKRVAVGE